MSENRTLNFRRNELLEELLSELKDNLQPAEEGILSRYKNTGMQYPLVLIMGPLRSGTTLFTQWLANTGLFAYPTNLLSRFYSAPIIGAKIQLLLTDLRYNFRDELGEFMQEVEYSSHNGKTTGSLAPNEFWYFWRRFFSEANRDVWTDEELQASMDTEAMRSELIGMMDVLQKPFAAKGMLFNYNIPFLDSILDKAIFIQIKRDPITNAASILEARKRQLGSEREWYSFKIPEYPQLKDLDPITQSVGQLHYINKAVTKGLSSVDETRKLVVQYEEFCENPETIFGQLVDKLGYSESLYTGPRQFKLTRNEYLPDREAIIKSFLEFERE